ncbi:hypothetical protein Bbelb_391630 [Branchiostoma belcheri]|nr:hypothetical protein Bbelb_391630 [Branchiostoma belcheri]
MIAEYFALKLIHCDINFDKRQYGSLKGRSTAHALVSLVDTLCSNTDTPSTICSVFATNFSKTFDRVHHHTVISKLLDKGLRRELIPWICDFISNRKQRVRYRGVLSSWEQLSCGVAQGTLLGPILFLTLIDDAASNTNTPTWKYVDDMNLLESRSLNQPSTLQHDLDELDDWFNTNHMLLNSRKCLTMHVNFSRNPPPLPPLQISEIPLAVVPCLKVLGLHIQNDLRWDKQVNSMSGAASKVQGMATPYEKRSLRPCNQKLPETELPSGQNKPLQ